MSPSHSYFCGWLLLKPTPYLVFPLSYIFGGSGAELVVLEQAEKKEHFNIYIQEEKCYICENSLWSADHYGFTKW